MPPDRETDSLPEETHSPEPDPIQVLQGAFGQIGLLETGDLLGLDPPD